MLKKYWLVCFVFSPAFNVLLQAVSGPLARVPCGRACPVFFLCPFPEPEEIPVWLYCCRHDFSDFTFVLSLEAFDQAGLEAMISLPSFLRVVWTIVSTARKHSLPFDASTCAYLSCLNTAWHVCLEDIL